MYCCILLCSPITKKEKINEQNSCSKHLKTLLLRQLFYSNFYSHHNISVPFSAKMKRLDGSSERKKEFITKKRQHSATARSINR